MLKWEPVGPDCQSSMESHLRASGKTWMNGHHACEYVSFAFGVGRIEAGYQSLTVGTDRVTTPLGLPSVLLLS